MQSTADPTHNTRGIIAGHRSSRFAPGDTMDTLLQSRADAPQAHDSVAAWFDPLLSERLAQAGFGTLEQLTQRINDAGLTWWYPVRGIGVRRAERVVQWLHEQQQSTGMEVNLRGLREHARARSSSCADA